MTDTTYEDSVKNEPWLYEIKPKGKFIDINFKEIWRYRDLLILFVKRDIVTVYKQTVLGPLWFVIQPLFTSVIFTLVFNKIGGVATQGIPSFLFNLAGVTLWNYFKECLNYSSTTFKSNASLFQKVYFPRVIVPGSKAISELFKYGIQFLIFVVFYLYFIFVKDAALIPSPLLFLVLPLSILCMALLGLGIGMILSAMTTKYRDLSILVSFGVGLLMYVSAVMYPLSEIQEKLPDLFWIIQYNPLSHIIDTYRNALLGLPLGSISSFILTVALSVILFLFGLIIFNKTEKTFIDTV